MWGLHLLHWSRLPDKRILWVLSFISYNITNVTLGRSSNLSCNLLLFPYICLTAMNSFQSVGHASKSHSAMYALSLHCNALLSLWHAYPSPFRSHATYYLLPCIFHPWHNQLSLHLPDGPWERFLTTHLSSAPPILVPTSVLFTLLDPHVRLSH